MKKWLRVLLPIAIAVLVIIAVIVGIETNNDRVVTPTPPPPFSNTDLPSGDVTDPCVQALLQAEAIISEGQKGKALIIQADVELRGGDFAAANELENESNTISIKIHDKDIPRYVVLRGKCLGSL